MNRSIIASTIACPALLLSLLTMSAGLSGCGAPIQNLDTRGVAVLTQQQLAAGSRQAGSRKLALPARGLILKLPRGTALPVRLRAQLPFGELEAGDNKLRFSRDVYVWITRGGVKVSPDLRRWVAIEQAHRGLAPLFGVPRRGRVSVGISATKGDGARLTLSVEQPAR